MTTDDLVRDALADLAPLAPADESAFAGVRRAVARRRRRRTAGRLAVVALAVGLVAGGGVAVALRSDESRVTTRPPTESRHVSFAGMSFELPDGWEVIRSGTDSMCVGPAGNPYPRYDDCSGLELHHGDPLPGFEMDEYRDHGPWGWYHQTDVSPCPNRPPERGQPLDGIQPGPAGYDPIDSQEVDVGGRVAAYDVWQARCERSGVTFSPRAWHLAEQQLLIVDALGVEEADMIVDSIRWLG